MHQIVDPDPRAFDALKLREELVDRALRGTALLTDDELAQYMRVDKRTLFEWRKLGMPFMRVAMRYRYNLPAVLLWIKGLDSGNTAAE